MDPPPLPVPDRGVDFRDLPKRQQRIAQYRVSLEIARRLANLEGLLAIVEFSQVSDEAMTEFASLTQAAKQRADEAQAAFDQVGRT